MGAVRADAATGPFRRRVFYIPGFDPFPPRRYRELYRREGAAQACISGHRLDLRAEGPAAWVVRAEIEGRLAESRHEVLVWNDLVQASMGQGALAPHHAFWRAARAYFGTRAFAALARLGRGPLIAALYPVGLLAAQTGAGLLAGWGAGAGVAALLGPLGWAALPAAFWAVQALAARVDRRLYAHYLLADYAYAAGHLGAWPEALDRRLDDFAARIGVALEDETLDEVLVVGHSSGAHLAVAALARALRARGRGGDPAPGCGAVGLLTLGQAIPMMSFLPQAAELRRDLAWLSRREDIFWLDVTAPADGCCYALVDPVTASGVAPPDARWPVVISAAFSETLSPVRWRALKRRYFRLHFQYLCAFDRPRDYDYFAITAGARALGERFAGRRSSPSVVRKAFSPYRSMAP